jgi:foldase protein PrsA
MRKLALVALALVLGLAVLAAACGSKIPTGAIATVDGQPITQDQFNQYINQAKAQASQPSQPPFPSVGTTAYKRYAAEIVNYLVTQQVVLNQADKLKITVTDQEVQQRLQQIATQYGGTPKMYAAAQKAGLDPTALKTYVKNSLLGQKVYEHVIASVKPTDKQMQDYYNKNKSQFDKPASRDVRQILVKTKAEALKVRALIAANDTPATWKTVAKKYSTDPGSKNNGGLYSGVTPGQMVAPFNKALFSLAKGQLSQPVKTQYGYHILEVVGINAPKASTYQSAKASIQSTLASQLQQTAWSDWLTKSRKASAIVYAAGFNPDQLTAAPAASPSSSATPTPAASSTK